MTLGTVPDPACPPDGALLRVEACGICGTDVRAFYNGDRRIRPGWILGHEICGELIEVGSEANGRLEASPGDLVHVISTLHCGDCRLCRNGNEHLCQNGGLMGFDYPGAYADLVPVPAVALKNVFRLPDGVDAFAGTFADPLSDAICGHKDLEIGPGDRVVVVGAGPIGTAHVALALAEGADVIYLFEHEVRRLELARAVLGDERIRYVDVTEEDPVEFVKSETEDGVERVIVACSNARAQEQALELAAPRGRVLFFGGLPKGTNTIDFPSNVLHYREVTVLGSYASRRRDQVKALAMLADNVGNLRAVVTRVVPLEEAPAAFPRLRAGEELKIVVAP
ncbi:MAG: alcohol dehydrogenase catalytic domain-containing protein [Actinomycetota bacterium]|nr:alcohol dehydrogenase catalytic domain-containing protein [Actinomycetota bacterium]